MKSLSRVVLRDLPLPARIFLALFLVSVGLGYVAALVQLHFQHASSGKLLPDAEDAVRAYHGRPGLSQLERLLLAGDGKPFNGGGSMGQAFSTRSAGWKGAINRRARSKKISLKQAETELRAERRGERLAMLSWIRAGASREDFERDRFVLPAPLSRHPLTEEFQDTSSGGKSGVRIATLVQTRCARCHTEGTGGPAAQIPLETWDQVHAFCEVETANGGVSVEKLAQTTHAHLFGLTMLYGLTGFLMTLTAYPGWFRGLLGALPLAAQLLEIGCWWLGRLDPLYARAVVVLGGTAATGLFLQIFLTLFHLFGKKGKVLLALLLAGAVLGGLAIKIGLIDPYLIREALTGFPEE